MSLWLVWYVCLGVHSCALWGLCCLCFLLLQQPGAFHMWWLFFFWLVPEMFLKKYFGVGVIGLTRDGACMMSWLFSFMNEAHEAVWGNGGLCTVVVKWWSCWWRWARRGYSWPALAPPGWNPALCNHRSISWTKCFLNLSCSFFKRAVLFLWWVFNFCK